MRRQRRTGRRFHRWARRSVGAGMVLLTVLTGWLGAVRSAASPPVPLLPMDVYGSVVDARGAPVTQGSVQAFLAGQADGAAPIAADGTFGMGPLTQQVDVQGGAADVGQPVTFQVNGESAQVQLPNGPPAPDVPWRSGESLQVVLIVNQAGVVGPLSVTTATLPDGTTGSPYTATLQATGGTPPYGWTVTQGNLPAGLILSPGGTVSGTPTAPGTSRFRVQVTDGAASTASVDLGITVINTGVAVTGTSTATAVDSHAPATAGGAGSPTPDTSATASGGTGSVTVADYDADPGPAPTFLGAGVYFDVRVSPGSSFTSVAIRQCGVGAGGALYWLDGDTWRPVSPPAVFDAASGCLSFTVATAGSSPTVADLTGTVFAVGGAPSVGPGGGGGAYVGPTAMTPPTVEAIRPTGGPETGGTSVTITGSGFTGATAVDFGSVPASSFTVDSDTQINAVAPAGSGTVDVTVTTPTGTSPATAADRFTYTGAPGAVSPAPTPPGSVVTFTDVPSTYWAYGAIESQVAEGIVSGFPDGTFRPEQPVTRAQFVKMLDLVLGLQAAGGQAPFADVPPSAWYAPYVAAAVQAGIVEGLTPTAFGPDEPVTREQLTVLLARALKLTRTATLHFTDDAMIDAWALPGVDAAVAAGYINGFPDGSFRPLATATRAQVAAMLARVLAGRAGR
jgi:hypothetical protein